MKNKLLSLLILSLFLIACEGDQGPTGPQGPQGPQGTNIVGQVFEISINFTPSNAYRSVVEFPQDIEVFESDIVMVYLLETQVDDPSGPIDVWAPLPQSFFLNNGGELVYNFNHTFLDVSLFLDGNVNLDTVPSEFTENQAFRIAILPADFADDPSVSLYNYNSVESQLKENHDFQVKRLD